MRTSGYINYSVKAGTPAPEFDRASEKVSRSSSILYVKK